MRRALVLSGGGSRGSYQIGVWQALEELGVRFSMVFGTSIGAINAALIAQGDLRLAQNLWDNMTAEKIAPDCAEALHFDRTFGNVREFLSFLLENAKRLRVDTGPLGLLIHEHVNEGRVRASGKKLGVMAVRFPSFQPSPIRLEDMESGSLEDWLLASAACFPIFRMKQIHGERYLDGAYSDNLPIDFALSQGADEVISVELHPGHTHPEYRRMPFLTTIAPTTELGGFLDFASGLLARNRERGYRDAMKRFQIYEGFAYTFHRAPDLLAEQTGRRLAAAIARLDAGEISRSTLSSKAVSTPLIRAMENFSHTTEALSYRQIFVQALEMAAQCLGFPPDPVYEVDSLIREMLEKVPFDFPENPEFADAASGDVSLVGALYRHLGIYGCFPESDIRKIVRFPEHVISALFLHFLKNAP